MDVITTGFGILVAVVLVVVIGLLILISRLFRKIDQGKALIISKVRKVDVTFTGAVVLPVAETWAVVPQVEYRDQNSNYDIRTWDDLSAMLGVQKRF